MNIENARTNMIKQQIRACDVLDDSLLELLQKMPRELFVPEFYKNLAFSDTEIPIGHGESMMTPLVEAKILSVLQVKRSDIVLEVGTGTGYLTALLAELAKRVFTLDVIPEFSKSAKTRLQIMAHNNVEFITADASEGWEKNAPYDVIVINDSLPTLPEAFKQQLSVGGRLFCILGKSTAMQATLVTRENESTTSSHVLFETFRKPLRHASSKSFHF